MKKPLVMVLLVVLIAWGVIGPVSAGTISGSVKVKGLRSQADILVYLAKGPSVSLELANARFVMDQRDLTFLPHVLPIPVGATVLFPNNDKLAHNVFSLSRTKKFNLGSYPPGESRTVLFDRPGIVELRCDVHAEMLAYILVMKDPYWALTDGQGRFVIPGTDYWKRLGVAGPPELPAGQYSVKTWHEKLRSARKTLAVPGQGQATIDLDLRRGSPSVLFK